MSNIWPSPSSGMSMSDSVKDRLREKLDNDPELKQEFKDAIGMYFEAKVKEMYANIKLAKASAKLGIDLMPEPLKDDFTRDLQKELGSIVDRIV